MKELLEAIWVSGDPNSKHHEPNFDVWFQANQTRIDEAIVKYLEEQGKSIIDQDFIVFGGITRDQFLKACEKYMR